MRERGRALAAALAGAVAAAACARDAAAADPAGPPSSEGQSERKHHLGISGGLSILKVGDKSTHSIGPGFGAHYAYQITDAFKFMAEFGSSFVAKDETGGPETPRTRPERVDNLGIGAGYVLDVSRKWVPYGGVLASGWSLRGGTLEKTLFAFGVQVAVGVDYMLTPSFAVGFAFRQHMLLSKTGDYPQFYSGLLRMEIVWGR